MPTAALHMSFAYNATLIPDIVYRVADMKWLISPLMLIRVSPLIKPTFGS